ncbi:Crp/Fnr family transcriptional regulator [Microvirga rosea]|uniref:Crp/Fnr family transcriptional regulator n=1 Tax=Microvirga rosea TaxID=2715425 RepID=UPI001D09D9C0|nr:Crp/Fnr family transcriptional regulator [Microvirga rosea]MCB8820226.1 Crp/Fnr family transcriptional regulator [Microvirga rosea]
MNFAFYGQADQHPLIRRLEGIADLSDEEKQAILALPLTVKVFEADTDVVREKDRPSDCCLIVNGFVCRYKLLPDGRRQIMGFYIPGDIPDLQSLHLHVMDNSIGTLVTASVAMIPHESLRKMLRRHPRLADILWRETLIDGAMLREWMVGIGRRTAYQRVAHLLCELQVRLKMIGLGKEDGYELPVTQNELGDALGLSTVHVNRVLQDLRGHGLIVLRGGALRIPDLKALWQVAEFNPSYLHLKES